MRPRQTATHIPVDQLMAHPDNIRHGLGDLTDLARSIQEHGILQPLTVTEYAGDGFLILAGHRRFRAGLKVGLTSFPAIVRHGLAGDHAEQLVVMLVENTQRRDLDPIEKGKAFQALVAEGLSMSELGRRLGVQWGGNACALIQSDRPMSRTTVDKAEALFEQLCMTPAPEDTQHQRISAARARNYAREHRWVPPLMLDDLDVDDAELVAS